MGKYNFLSHCEGRSNFKFSFSGWCLHQPLKNGNWYNPKTGESLRPDLNHADPIGPHWDYKDPNGKWWRIFPVGRNVPK